MLNPHPPCFPQEKTFTRCPPVRNPALPGYVRNPSHCYCVSNCTHCYCVSLCLTVCALDFA